MNSSVINSSLPFNHSSSGSSLQFLIIRIFCDFTVLAWWFLVAERSISFVVGYPANLMVMWLVARGKSDSSTSDIFIFSLAFADALFCVMSSICALGLLLLRISYFNNMMSFITGIKNSSPLFLTCICLDRYVAVVHPIVFTSMKDKKIRVAISILVWAPMMAYGLITTMKPFVAVSMFFGLIMAAFTIMVFCNISIMWSLRKSVLSKEKMHPMKKKALRTVQIYLGIIMFHYLPVVLFRPLMYIPYLPNVCDIQKIIDAITNLSTITAPLLYITLIKQLPWLKNLFCICCRSPSPE